MILSDYPVISKFESLQSPTSSFIIAIISDLSGYPSGLGIK